MPNTPRHPVEIHILPCSNSDGVPDDCFYCGIQAISDNFEDEYWDTICHDHDVEEIERESNICKGCKILWAILYT